MRRKLADLGRFEIDGDITVNGRVVAIRKHRKTIFFDLEDDSGKFQGIVEKEKFDSNPIKIGDIIQGTGSIGKTKTNHSSLYFNDYTFLVRPLDYKPSEADIRNLVLDRSLLEDTVSNFFRGRGVFKVDTSELSEYSGSSEIVPFKTSHRGKKDYFLRFTMELELKKLVAKTQLPVFEIGRVFRDMGESNRRSLEYKSCEAYIPYLNLEQGFWMIEDLFRTLAKTFEIDIEGIPRKKVKEICLEISGDQEFSLDESMKRAYKKKIKMSEGPLLVIHPPHQWSSPLYVRNSDGTSQEGRLLYRGLGTLLQVCEESTDYESIISSLYAQQTLLKERGRSPEIDSSFLEAIKFGLPPCIGVHVGLDRLLMAFRNKRNITEVKI